MKGATLKQSKILEYILEFPVFPTIQKIADNFGMSTKAVAHHIQVLKRIGLIDSQERKSRTIRITGKRGNRWR